MEAIVVRIELEPQAAELLGELVDAFVGEREGRLLASPPQHTRARLEEQRETGEAMQRAIRLAIANPELVEVPDPSDA